MGLSVSFLYSFITRRLGLGFTIRYRSSWLTVDHHSIHVGTAGRWEASWSPEDGALRETAQAGGGWLTKAWVPGQGWTSDEVATA